MPRYRHPYVALSICLSEHSDHRPSMPSRAHHIHASPRPCFHYRVNAPPSPRWPICACSPESARHDVHVIPVALIPCALLLAATCCTARSHYRQSVWRHSANQPNANQDQTDPLRVQEAPRHCTISRPEGHARPEVGQDRAGRGQVLHDARAVRCVQRPAVKRIASFYCILISPSVACDAQESPECTRQLLTYEVLILISCAGFVILTLKRFVLTYILRFR